MTQSMPVMAEDQAEWELEQPVKSGVFPDRRSALRTALRALYLRQPEARLRMILRAYEAGEISLGRAAEVMGVSPEEMKDVLREAGTTVQLGPVDAAELLEDSRPPTSEREYAPLDAYPRFSFGCRSSNRG